MNRRRADGFVWDDLVSEGPRISVRRGNTSELMPWLDGAMEQLERMMISALAAWDETPDEAQGMTLDELLGEIDDVLGGTKRRGLAGPLLSRLDFRRLV